MQDLTPEQRQALQNVALQIVNLTSHHGWQHFEAAIKTVIDAELPRADKIKNADDAVMLASKSVFVAGLRRALQIPEQYREILDSLQEKRE